ncbi:TonB-dependent receptor [Roseivirga sp. BDSF3-8]|uniref:TonB-dependent receptor n=1 Tax=Roseivirga sp. BDSF3-8 TaxID=3241598 RepID=UPI0035321AE5
MKKLAITGLLVLCTGITFAQKQGNESWEEENLELEDTKVVIEKEKELELPLANRPFNKIPPQPVSQEGVEDLQYEVQRIPFQGKILEPRVRVLKIKEESPVEPYRNHVKGGLGNYATAYFEGFFNSKRHPDYQLGARVRHLSSGRGPVDRNNSATASSGVGLEGKFFTREAVFDGTAAYSRDRHYFYGYDPALEIEDRDSIRQVFNFYEVSAGIGRNQPDSRFTYNGRVGFSMLDNQYDARENSFNFNLHTAYEINDEVDAMLDSDLWLSDKEDVGDISRYLFRLSPVVKFKVQDALFVHAGFKAVYENDTIENADQLHLFPNLQATYYLTPDFIAYAGIGGDVEKRTLRSLTNENPWVKQGLPVFHTINTFDLSAGVRGKLLNRVGFHTGFSLGAYKNPGFFVNSEEDSTRFDLVYETDNMTRFNYFGEVTYSAGETFRTTLRGDYYAYSVDNLGEAWHRPTYRFNWLGRYNLFEKIIFQADLNLLGGINTLNLANETREELDPIADLSFRTEYIFSDQATAFIRLNNIIGGEYERYRNYPVRGFQVMLGASYSF